MESPLDIKTPFDDDSHTLHDGPIPRFFRMRKWFFATGLSLLLLDTGWWDYQSTMDALALSAVPKNVIHIATTLTGAYLMAQASLVATQIGATYGNTILVRSKLIRSAAANDLFERADKMEESLRERLGPQRFAELAGGFDIDPPGGYSFGTHSRGDVDAYLMAQNIRREALEIERRQTARSLVLGTEVALDMMRIVPTLGFLIYSVFVHGRLP